MKFNFDVKIPEITHTNGLVIKECELHIGFETNAEEIVAHGDVMKAIIPVFASMLKQ